MSDSQSGSYGDAHGQQNWFRWEPSTALAVILLVAVVVLFFTGIIKIRVGASAGVAV